MVDNLLMIKAEEILEKIEKGKPVEYENVIIYGDLDLHSLDLAFNINKLRVIKSIIKIEYSVIKGDVFFDHAAFFGLVDFDGTTFTKAANFSGSHFQEDAGFSHSQFQEEANFSRAHFAIDANFSRARFNDADFGRARFEKYFHLSNAKVYTLKLSDAFFSEGSSIHLKDFNFNRIAVRWNSIKSHVPFNGSVYLTLIRNFRNLEQFEDQDDCYYQYRTEKQARSPKIFPRLFDRLAWISCGYGVRPSHTILLSVAIILLFMGIFWVGDALQPDGGQALLQDKANISLNDAFYFSSMQFLGKTPKNFSIIEGYEVLTVTETLMGWLLMALFLVTLSRVMLR
ncbi:MAG: pentapeptide repeat-containing protein [Methanotrichaceae archaeon]|nr:pentapeptide repeat-containing protein [Methanotrichaceae archaeon]